MSTSPKVIKRYNAARRKEAKRNTYNKKEDKGKQPELDNFPQKKWSIENI